MSENQYPVFTGGQSLTASELNDLRAFLDARDRLVGRAVGFGVSCGLGGTVTVTGTGPGATSQLTVAPGLAIDQTGEALVLPAAGTLDLAPPAMTPSYDFVDAAPGGFSVVLEATDTVEPAPDCGEADCAGHAELHTRTAVLRTVAGRVTGTRMDFAADPLLAAEPIRLALDGTPTTSYTALRDAIATRLTNGGTPLVRADLVARLSATSIATSDTTGIKGYKAGWLNMVLFATLDLLRALALLDLRCDRTTTRPGVVLGWVHQVSSAWVFECAYRHAWEPPRGVTEALIGGTCADPAGSYRDDLEAVLAGFAPPDPPVSDPVPPKGCPAGSIRIGDRCVPIHYPPPTIPPWWRDRYRVDVPEVFDPSGPVIRWPDRSIYEVDTIYDRPPVDVLGEKGFGVTDYLGHEGAAVKTVLDGYIASTGAIADVKVMPVAETQTLEGFALAGVAAPSDTVVIGVDGAGTVVSMGRVPAVQNVRTVGSALPAAVGAAAEATAAAAELRGVTTTFGQRLDSLDSGFGNLQTNLGTLSSDFTSYKASFDGGALSTRLGTLEDRFSSFDVGALSTRLGTLEDRFSSFDPGSISTRLGSLENRFTSFDEVSGKVSVLEGKLDVLSTRTSFDPRTGTTIDPGRFGGGVLNEGGSILAGGGIASPAVMTPGIGALGTVVVKGLDKPVGEQLADFARTTVDALRALPAPRNRRFPRYAAAAERAHEQLREVAAPDAPDDPSAVGTAALEVLGTLRTLVKAAGVSKADGRRLDAQVRQLGDLLR